MHAHTHGTAAVLADLRGMGRGFDDGLLVFRHGCIARAPDGRVVGYQKSHLVPVASGEGRREGEGVGGGGARGCAVQQG